MAAQKTEAILKISCPHAPDAPLGQHAEPLNEGHDTIACDYAALLLCRDAAGYCDTSRLPFITGCLTLASSPPKASDDRWVLMDDFWPQGAMLC